MPENKSREVKTDSPGPPPWLVRIQENSWEAEIILSGLVLFSLLRAPVLLFNARLYLTQETSGFNDLWYFEAAGLTAVQFLIWGFLFHLVMRGIWVGLVGLSYVFPKGITSAGLKFQPRFAGKVEELWIVPAIIRMERTCSMIFSFSLMFFFIVLGISFFYLCYNWFFYMLLNYIDAPTLVRQIGYSALKLAAALYFLDFFTGGLLRRIPKVSAFYYPVHHFMRIFTLAFFYERIYLTLIANMDRRRLAAFLILLGFAAYFSLKNHIAELNRFSGDREVQTNEYDNLRPAGLRVARASIQADVIKDHTIRLFVPHNARLEEPMTGFCGLDEDVGRMLKKRSETLLSCVNRYITLTIDNKPVDNIEWFFHQKPKTDDIGYLAWIDIRDQKPGPHRLAIRLADNPRFHRGRWCVIPFYRE